MEIGGIADYAYSNDDITRIISGTAASVTKQPERITLTISQCGTRQTRDMIIVLFSSLFDKSNNRITIFSRGVLTREITRIISAAAASPVANSRPEWRSVRLQAQVAPLSRSFHCTAYKGAYITFVGPPYTLLAAPTLRVAAGVVCRTPCGTAGSSSRSRYSWIYRPWKLVFRVRRDADYRRGRNRESRKRVVATLRRPNGRLHYYDNNVAVF